MKSHLEEHEHLVVVEKLEHIRLKAFPLKHLVFNSKTITFFFWTFLEHFEQFFSLESVSARELLEQLGCKWQPQLQPRNTRGLVVPMLFLENFPRVLDLKWVAVCQLPHDNQDQSTSWRRTVQLLMS